MIQRYHYKEKRVRIVNQRPRPKIGMVLEKNIFVISNYLKFEEIFQNFKLIAFVVFQPILVNKFYDNHKIIIYANFMIIIKHKQRCVAVYLDPAAYSGNTRGYVQDDSQRGIPGGTKQAQQACTQD